MEQSVFAYPLRIINKKYVPNTIYTPYPVLCIKNIKPFSNNFSDVAIGELILKYHSKTSKPGGTYALLQLFSINIQEIELIGSGFAKYNH